MRRLAISPLTILLVLVLSAVPQQAFEPGDETGAEHQARVREIHVPGDLCRLPVRCPPRSPTFQRTRTRPSVASR